MRPNLRFLRDYIVAKNESYFSHGSRLVWVHACGTEGETRREAARPNKRKVSANEEASVLKGGRQSGRPGRAARSVHQVHSLISDAPRARDIFPASCEREAVFEGVTHQECTALGRGTLHDTDLQVSRHIAILIIGLDDPGAFGVSVNGSIHSAVVLHGGGQGLKGCLPQVSHPNERQAVRPIAIS